MPENEKNKINQKETPSGREIRDISPGIAEMRVDDNSKLIGYASKYGNFYDLGWFKERIKAGAFDDVLGDDVRCLKNHDPNYILGRTASGTLELESNSAGLKFMNDMPDTSTGRDTLEEVRRGDISGCSFSFIVAEDEWKYYEDENKPAERTITKIGQLFDVGPVVFPANTKTSVFARDTEVAKRSFEAAKKQEAEEIEPFLEDTVKLNVFTGKGINVMLTSEQQDLFGRTCGWPVKVSTMRAWLCDNCNYSNPELEGVTINEILSAMRVYIKSETRQDSTESQDEPKVKEEIPDVTPVETPEERKRRYKYEKDYRTAGRIINRCKPEN